MNFSDKSSESFPGRTFYKSSGRVSPVRFIALSCFAVIVAALLAMFMFWLFVQGQYYVMIVPLLCALGVLGAGILAVRGGHCRNRLLAALMGVLLSVVLYIGSFYVGMIHEVGWDEAGNLALLKAYIELRAATDIERDAAAPSHATRAEHPHVGMNWIRFALESAFVLFIVTGGMLSAARKPYCEECGRWLKRSTSPIESAQTPALLEALRNGHSPSLVSIFSRPPHHTFPNLTIALDYCPSLEEERGQDCPPYLSAKEFTSPPKNATLNSFEKAKGRVLIKALRLERDELPALGNRFPFLAARFGRATSASPPALTASEQPVSDGKALAKITMVESHPDGRVLDRKTKLIGNAYSFSGLLYLFGGLGFLLWGALLCDPEHGQKNVPGGVCLAVLGGLSVLRAVVGMFLDSSFGGTKYLQRRFLRRLADRTGCIVDRFDPAARFVEIVPKTNWGKMMLDNASDIGLLIVDKARREIRFEGDMERWRIPADSLTSCALETYVHRQGNSSTTYYYVVLRAARPEGFWEAPVRTRQPSGLLSRKRKKAEEALAREIKETQGHQSLMATAAL